MARVHISCPISVSKDYLHEVWTVLSRKGHWTTHWDRKEHYDENWIREADAVVFILPHNQFEMSRSELPIGVKVEFDRSRKLNKPRFIAYKVQSTGEIRIYKTCDLHQRDLKGVAGTSDAIDNIGTQRAKVLENRASVRYEISSGQYLKSTGTSSRPVWTNGVEDTTSDIRLLLRKR